MALLFNIIDEKTKQKYIEKGNVCKTHVQQGISPEKYRIPNNSKASATYLWSNLLQVAPCMDGHTFIITFIPQSNPNIIVRARFSNHPCGGRKNWDKYETIGEPNKRVDIYFFNQTDNNTPVDGYENNLINNSHIYNDDDITKLCAALTNFFTTGIFIHPFVNSTSIQENKQYRNTNTEMKKQTIKLNESQLRNIIKESIKNILREGYLNDGDQDIREILANLAYNAIKQVCPQCADHFTPLGGNGNSCGVYVLLSPYDMELSDKSQQKLEQWSDEQKKYALYCFETDYPDFKEKHKTPEYADAFDDYYERYNFDSAIGRIEIDIELEGAMEGKGWYMYDVKHVTGIEVTVNSFVYDEDDNNKTICSDCLYKKNINFGDTENDVEYFSHIPEWLQKDINDSLIEAATVIKNIW